MSMIRHLFFNLPGTTNEVVKKVFTVLGVDDYFQGESINVRNEEYFVISIFGITIKLEENSYEYEDQYDYFLSFREDPIKNLILNPSIKNEVFNIARELIISNLLIEVAEENHDGLKIFKLKD